MILCILSTFSIRCEAVNIILFNEKTETHVISLELEYRLPSFYLFIPYLYCSFECRAQKPRNLCSYKMMFCFAGKWIKKTARKIKDGLAKVFY